MLALHLTNTSLVIIRTSTFEARTDLDRLGTSILHLIALMNAGLSQDKSTSTVIYIYLFLRNAISALSEYYTLLAY
jgi:hypothetical protein